MPGAHILKVAGIRQLLSDKNRKNIKASGEKRIVFLHLLHFRDLSDSPLLLFGIFIHSPLKLKLITMLMTNKEQMACMEELVSENLFCKNKIFFYI